MLAGIARAALVVVRPRRLTPLGAGTRGSFKAEVVATVAKDGNTEAVWRRAGLCDAGRNRRSGGKAAERTASLCDAWN